MIKMLGLYENKKLLLYFIIGIILFGELNMKLVFAFDSYKGTLDARDLCRIALEKFAEWEPSWSCYALPLADGGENTATIIAEHLDGRECSLGDVQGPLESMRCDGRYVELPGRRAVVEMANCSGLAQLGLFSGKVMSGLLSVIKAKRASISRLLMLTRVLQRPLVYGGNVVNPVKKS